MVHQSNRFRQITCTWAGAPTKRTTSITSIKAWRRFWNSLEMPKEQMAKAACLIKDWPKRISIQKQIISTSCEVQLTNQIASCISRRRSARWTIQGPGWQITNFDQMSRTSSASCQSTTISHKLVSQTPAILPKRPSTNYNSAATWTTRPRAKAPLPKRSRNHCQGASTSRPAKGLQLKATTCTCRLTWCQRRIWIWARLRRESCSEIQITDLWPTPMHQARPMVLSAATSTAASCARTITSSKTHSRTVSEVEPTTTSRLDETSEPWTTNGFNQINSW